MRGNNVKLLFDYFVQDCYKYILDEHIIQMFPIIYRKRERQRQQLKYRSKKDHE